MPMRNGLHLRCEMAFDEAAIVIFVRYGTVQPNPELSQSVFHSHRNHAKPRSWPHPNETDRDMPTGLDVAAGAVLCM